MKIGIIGDPHGDLKSVKKFNLDVDLILCTGDLAKSDISRNFFFDNLKRSKNGLGSLSMTSKIKKQEYLEIINSSVDLLKYVTSFGKFYSLLGNVGRGIILKSKVNKDETKYGIKLPSYNEKLKKIKNFNLVRNGVRVIDGLRVGFIDYYNDYDWCKEFKIKDKNQLAKFKKDTTRIKKILKNMKNIDTLITHIPPYGYLDQVKGEHLPKDWVGKHAGSKIILNYIKKEQPKYVFCGHIHEAKGKAKIGSSEVFNLGLCGYKILNF